MSERNVESTQLRDPPAGPDLAAGVGGIGAAIAASALGGLLVALAPLMGVVSAAAGSVDGPSAPAAACTAVLSVGTPLFALLLLRGGRVLGAAGVLGGWAAAGIGTAVLDGQLFTRPIDANRFELFRPASAAALQPGAGAFVVLAGHVLIVLAGVLALWAVQRSALLDDSDGLDIGLLGGANAEARGVSLAAMAGRAVTTVAGLCAVVIAAALFAPPLSSADPVVLVSTVVESARPLLVGSALLAVAVLVVVALALVSTSVATGAGAVAGVALGVLAVCGPRLVAGAVLDRLGVGIGSVLAVIAAVVLAACAAVLARALSDGGEWVADRAATDVRLPGSRGMHLLTAVSGLLAGAAAVAGGLLPALSTPPGVAQPQVYSARVLLLAGVVLAALCAAMLTEMFAAVLRPAVSIAWVGLVLGASGVLQAVLVAITVPGVGAGSGGWLAVVAVLLGACCGLFAGLAGAVERDDVDTSVQLLAGRPALAAGAVAALAAVLGLALPLYGGAEVSAAALFTGSWGWDSWGLLAVAVGVVGALVVAGRSRPRRAVALLAGVELVLAIHLLSWPLTAGRLPDSSVGAGAFGTVVALVAVPVMGALLWRDRGS